MATESSRTFTNADDGRLAELVCQAQQRLVFAAPGLSLPVADALAGRICADDPPPQIAVILDVDPEVCRLGFGTLEGLEAVTKALESRGMRLQTAAGLRVGLLISDDDTLIYSPTPLLLEAGSTAPTKPNAILLQPNAVQALAKACGVTDAGAEESHPEIGLDYLNQRQLQAVKADLAENPPKKFDLARIERVFNYELQFVEFKVKDYELGQRIIPLDAGWLGLSDKELKDRFRNTFRLFESGEGIEVELPAPKTEEPPPDPQQEEHFSNKTPRPKKDPATTPTPKMRRVTERTINKEAQRLRKFLIPLGPYGTVVLKRKRPEFEKEVDAFKTLVEEFGKEVKERIADELKSIRDRLMKDLVPGLTKNPPKEWLDRSISGSLDEERIRKMLGEGLDRAFGGVSKDFDPKVTLVFKDVTYTTIVGDSKFRERLEAYFGPEEVAKLFHEHQSAREASHTDKLHQE